MLVDFQQALADLTASPDLCNAVRDDALVVKGRYQLSERETRRLLAIVHHPGMACACENEPSPVVSTANNAAGTRPWRTFLMTGASLTLCA